MDQNRVVELALEALQKQKMATEDEIRELTAQLKGRGHVAAMPLAAPAGRRAHRRAKSGPQSAAARKAVGLRMKAYWAKRRAQTAKAPVAKKAAPAKAVRRTMSAAAKKAISQKMKIAWAKRKAAAKTPAPKKAAPAKPQQSAAARKAQSDRMKEIWAKRKAEKPRGK